MLPITLLPFPIKDQLIRTCRPFYPTRPNPLILTYRNRPEAATSYNIPISLIGDCVDQGVRKVEVLIAAFGEEALIRPEQREGDFQCELAGLRLNVNFYPQQREPTYQEVEWSLLAIQEASLNRTVNFRTEATIFVQNTYARQQMRMMTVSRVEMFYSDVQTKAVAVT